MLQPWIISLLSVTDTREFFYKYDKGPIITVSGKLIDGEWVTSGRVESELFIYGWNHYHTGVKGSFHTVIAADIMDVINTMTEYKYLNRDELLTELRVFWKNK